MCDWSNWRFICDGRYDILLAILTGAALFAVGTMMLLSYFKKRGGVGLPVDRVMGTGSGGAPDGKRKPQPASESNQPE